MSKEHGVHLQCLASRSILERGIDPPDLETMVLELIDKGPPKALPFVKRYKRKLKHEPLGLLNRCRTTC